MAKSLTFAVDLDGPCYEFDKTARYMLRKYRGCTGLEEPSREWFFHSQDWHNVDKRDWRWLWTHGVELGLFRYGHMTRDARVGLLTLVEQGHQIVLATKRPARAVNDTIDWVSLFFRGIPLSGIHFFTDKESKAELGADVLIDDMILNCKEWGMGGYIHEERTALLFDRPWNQEWGMDTDNYLHTKGVVRVKGWEEVLQWSTMHQNRT